MAQITPAYPAFVIDITGETFNIENWWTLKNYVIEGSGAIAVVNSVVYNGTPQMNEILTFYVNLTCTNATAGIAVDIMGRSLTDVELAHPSILQIRYDGSAWQPRLLQAMEAGALDGAYLAAGTVSPAALTDTPWIIDGNAGTDPSVNFVGTTDNADFVGKRNNIRAWRLAVDETSFGVESGYVTAKHNTYFGSRAGKAGSTGRENVSVGYEALTANTVGNYNTAIGTLASNVSTNGDNNTNVGYKSLFNNASGDSNTVVGASSALTITSGGKNTLLGANTDIDNAAGVSRTALGESAVATKDYQLFLAANIAEAEFNKTNLRVGAITQNFTATTQNATGTLTGAQILSGLITSTSAAATAMTLPTGTDLGAALNAVRGTEHTFSIDNSAGASTVTVVVNTDAILSALAVANAASFGLLTIPSGVTGTSKWLVRFTTTTAYTITRIG